MKKQLLTTTAVGGLAALLAVPAAAQDADFGISGFARMGLAYQDDTEDFDAEYRFQLTTSFKIVADAGLTFGGKARMRIDENQNDAGFNNPVLYVSTGDVKLSMGNIDGVIFNVPSSYVGTGLDGNGSHGTAVYFDGAQSVTPLEYASSGTGPTNGVQLDYSMAGFALSVMNTDDQSGVSVTYSQDSLSLGAAYQQDDAPSGDDTLIVVGATYEINALTLGAAYAVADVDATAGDGSKWSVNGSYDFSEALSASAFFASEDNGAGDGESYGLSVSRTLGSGVTAVAGWEQDVAEVNYLSAGVKMNF